MAAIGDRGVGRSLAHDGRLDGAEGCRQHMGHLCHQPGPDSRIGDGLHAEMGSHADRNEVTAFTQRVMQRGGAPVIVLVVLGCQSP